MSALVLNPEASRLYRVRKTVVKMLANRGYIVSDDELKRTTDGFAAQFGENPTREMMTILVEKVDDPSDNLFVFYPDDAKVGVKPIRTYCNRMKDENVTKAILIVQVNATVMLAGSSCHLGWHHALCQASAQRNGAALQD